MRLPRLTEIERYAVGDARRRAGAPAPAPVAWVLAAFGATIYVLVLEFLHPVAYRVPTELASVETVLILCGFAAAWLLGAQFLRTRRLRELLLLTGILTLVLLDVASNALPAWLALHSGSRVVAATMIGKLFAAAMFAAAAATPSDRLVPRRGRPLVAAVALSVAAVPVSALFGLGFEKLLAVGAVTPAKTFEGAVRHPLALTLVLATAILFVFAALCFASRAMKERRGMASVVAGTAMLLAGVQLYHLIAPATGPSWISSRDALQFVAFALVLMAAARESIDHRRTFATAAAIAERRRVARDLHDGLAQDLAFIAVHGARIATESGEDHPIVIAARRALALSRETISDLSDPASTNTHDALEAVAHELRNRFPITINVDVPHGIEFPPDARADATRIVREAIANAASHGGADHVIVSLEAAHTGVVLKVRDDGCGLDDDGGVALTEGFGLRSIRERAASMGGRMSIRHPDGIGTELEVVVP